MIQYSGIKNIVEELDVDLNNVLAAFSFYNPDYSNNYVYPDTWSINSATGVLNQNNNFFTFSGSGYFDGSTYMQLSGKNFPLENSLIFISYEKKRLGSEILLSSFGGNALDSYSGFNFGVNDANKLYLSYWNNVEGYFTFTCQNILSDKNLVLLYKNGPTISIGRYNNNTFAFEIEDFNIFQNVFVESNDLYLGGAPLKNVFNQNDLNFSGYIDKFFVIKDNNIYFAKDSLAVGLYSNFSSVQNIGEDFCFQSGYFSGSGFLYSGELERYLSGYEIISTGITGYESISSGYSYSGITGYESISVGFFVDNCGNSEELFSNIPLSGLIITNINYNNPLTGIIYNTGNIEIVNSGIISGTSLVWITGLFCTENIISLPEDQNIVDINYLKSLSYKQISLLSTIINDDQIEIFTDKYTPSELIYNKDYIYNNLENNFFEFNDVNNNIMVYANGQLLISSGYSLLNQGYDTFIIPNFDYIITGNKIETNKYFSNEDYLFYDNISGRSWAIKSTGYTIDIPENLSSNYWVFRNGQKLISGKDYIKGLNTLTILDVTNAEENNILIKEVPNNFIYYSGNSGSLRLTGTFNHGCSQVYFNGIKQKINNNYFENSNFDLISGNFYINNNLNIIYNNTDDFLT